LLLQQRNGGGGGGVELPVLACRRGQG
jgi:hypothetical protein